ncbi:MAG: hypothetical protein RJA60_582, partial [Actinomycetota bacterium]
RFSRCRSALVGQGLAMAGFLFWKKKRGAEVEAPEFETPVVIETNESLVADAAEAA